jgi:two-component system, OmpR family, response regulator
MRILCVDDNEDAVDSLGTLLAIVGCNVAVASDAVKALAQVEEFRPQVCILDITMPGMDGCELASRLRDGTAAAESLLIALTALGDYNSLERIAAAGFDLYFTKPIEPKELFETLNRFAEKGRPRLPE